MKNRATKPKLTAKRKTHGENLHVVHRNDGWVVRTEGRSRAASIHGSQREAIEAARKLAQEASTTLVIHGRDGRIRERNSYMPDPLPPREPRKVLYPSSSPNTSRQMIRKAVNEAVRETSEQQRLVSKAS
jgi:hypothetical protein